MTQRPMVKRLLQKAIVCRLRTNYFLTPYSLKTIVLQSLNIFETLPQTDHKRKRPELC